MTDASTAAPPTPKTTSEERETGRLEAFSDGVFAIAITLLILEIQIPKVEHGLWGAVTSNWPFFAAYAVSFLTILVMWINHHALFKQIHRIDRVFLVLNGLLLMVITFVNYPTALVAEYFRDAGEGRTAMVIYSGTFILIAILFSSLWFYAARGNRLLARDASPAFVAAISRAYTFGPFLYVAATLLALVSVPASFIVNAGLALYFALTGRDV